MRTQALRIAIQKSGRLSEKSISLFNKCGLDFDFKKDCLIQTSKDFPVELLLVRDDDIPAYVRDGVCDLGIVGENIVREKRVIDSSDDNGRIQVVSQLGFGSCRLSIAVPTAMNFESLVSLRDLRIATSYPVCLQAFLEERQVRAEIIELSGSVEVAPALGIADAVCDLVSSGRTLLSNGLREVVCLFTSQAVLIRNPKGLDESKELLINRLLQRIQGVLRASNSKYIMMNAPRSALPQIRDLLPGLEEPTVIGLGTDGLKVAVHAVSREDIFWQTIEGLKKVGASSILVLPIEKVIA